MRCVSRWSAGTQGPLWLQSLSDPSCLWLQLSQTLPAPLEMWTRSPRPPGSPRVWTPEVCPALGCERPHFSLTLPLRCISRPLTPRPSTSHLASLDRPLQLSSSSPPVPLPTLASWSCSLGTPPSCPVLGSVGCHRGRPGPRLASPSALSQRWRQPRVQTSPTLWSGSLCPSPACL